MGRNPRFGDLRGPGKCSQMLLRLVYWDTAHPWAGAAQVSICSGPGPNTVQLFQLRREDAAVPVSSVSPKERLLQLCNFHTAKNTILHKTV